MYSLFVLFFLEYLSIISCDEISLSLTNVKDKLTTSANQLSLTIFLGTPDAAEYLNFDLVKNSPNRLNLTNELMSTIREWSPRLLALDPTSPYYFSTLTDMSQDNNDPNLLSYLQASKIHTIFSMDSKMNRDCNSSSIEFNVITGISPCSTAILSTCNFIAIDISM
jgi:hypothetical protein